MVERREETQFLLHILDDRLDYQVAIGEIFHVERAMQAAAVLVNLSLSELALARHHVPGGINTRHALVEQGLVDFAYHRLISGLSAGLGDSSPHQSAANHANHSYSHLSSSFAIS